MEQFKTQTIYDSDCPAGITSFKLVTPPINAQEILKFMKQFGNIAVAKHKNYILFFNEDLSEVYAMQLKHDSSPSPHDEPNVNFDKSKLFTSVLLTIVILFNSILISFGAVSGSMEDNLTLFPGLKNVSFRTATAMLEIEPRLVNVDSKDYQTIGYSFDDPRPLVTRKTLSSKGIHSAINKDLISAILAYDVVNSLEQIRQSTGFNITAEQVKSAIQLSLWKQSATVYREYQIQENSITDATVRSLSTEIDLWATNQVNNRRNNQLILDLLLPESKPVLDASHAGKNVDALNTTFGPYIINSKSTMQLIAELTGGVIIDQTGTIINEVQTGQTFYVVYPLAFTGSTEVKFIGKSIKYELGYSNNRVWLHQNIKNVEVAFSLSTSIGSNGIINFKVLDSLTNMPLQGVEIIISNATSSVSSGITNEHGLLSVELPVAQYSATVKSPQGYMGLDSMLVILSFIGDIQNVNIVLSRTEGTVNFFGVDASTLTNTGYSEAYVFREGKAIKRLALQEGQCLAIPLEEGDYTASIYKSTGGYSLSTLVSFSVLAGQSTDVIMNQVASTPRTTVQISDTKDKAYWKMSFYQGGSLWFSVNNKGVEDFNLPFGEYQVVVESNDGLYKSAPFSFQIATTDSTITVPLIIGTESVVFNIVDTVIKEPIPSLIVGVFDENHVLMQTGVLDARGSVTFSELILYNIYYFNVISGPDSVSGYSANGNRFLGKTDEFTIEFYSQEEISTVTAKDTMYRIPGYSFKGNYIYPEVPPNVASSGVKEEKNE